MEAGGGTAEDGDEQRHQPPRRCCGGAAGVMELKLRLNDPGFDLEKAVCSHGLFMMAPNQWDPATRTFRRPLRLCCPSSSFFFTPLSVVLRISHPHPRPSALHISVLGTGFLSYQHKQVLLAQVRRMLRITDEDDRVVEEFHRMHPAAKERGFGRVFRSPTLFEDMVKCILLCNCHSLPAGLFLALLFFFSSGEKASFFRLREVHGSVKLGAAGGESCIISPPVDVGVEFSSCSPIDVELKQLWFYLATDCSSSRWSRTLSMARALCELQLELRRHSTAESLHPRTPQQKELKSKHGCIGKTRLKLDFIGNESEALTCRERRKIDDTSPKCPKEQESCSSAPCILKNSCDCLKPCPISNIDVAAKGTVSPCDCKIGEFPSPEELAGLDEKFLAKRCGLGYRAKRILSLAQSIVEGKLKLEELEESCDILNPSSYDELNERLSRLDGFGPFTRANVLMCMGFYHKIPADSETIRHLKQFHLRSCTIEMIEKYAEDIYGEHAPLQFLAYWSELWNFYEQRFGKLSEMPPSDYQLITARNMKNRKTSKKRRRN
ncbi:hypothetical protein Taro_009662 [Colocasia esculenta]|uniref:DNA-(apurinic or apyrimidinic site) lyase n=1 Tax=Colocasia esculenta TaxID=4460 RepID=A0A843U1G7_COLES|nr:hypothetical protein [Colocasia esculenta]